MTRRTKDEFLTLAADCERQMMRSRKERNKALAQAQRAGAILSEMADATGLSIEGVRKAISQQEGS